MLTKQKQSPINLLTKAELGILQLLAKGLMYQEVALKKEITIDTVKKHCNHIYKKLNVKNRTQAIIKLGRSI